MRQDPLLDNIGGMLRRFKRAEAWLRNAGLPIFLARAPVWLLCLQYCIMMKAKTARIVGIAERIARWHDTIAELAQHEKARTELIDMDSGMRNDIESTKCTLLQLRELSLDVGGMFGSIGFKSVMLDRIQGKFLAVVDESCAIATRLQRALETHDTRALALLRQMQELERSISAAGQAGGDASPDAGSEAAMGEGADTLLRALPHTLPTAMPNTVSDAPLHREVGDLPLGAAATAAKA